MSARRRTHPPRERPHPGPRGPTDQGSSEHLVIRTCRRFRRTDSSGLIRRVEGADVTEALVLGGGGVGGIAWMTGLLTGLADAGRDVTGADLIVGTSAGSTVAAQLGSGLSLEKLYARQVEPSMQAAEIMAEMDLAAFAAELAALPADGSDILELRRAVGDLALRARTVPEAERRAVIEARLPRHEWPTRPTRIVAVDAVSGRPRVFDNASGVGLVDAMAASCAVPGVWAARDDRGPPVRRRRRAVHRQRRLRRRRLARPAARADGGRGTVPERHASGADRGAAARGGRRGGGDRTGRGVDDRDRPQRARPGHPRPGRRSRARTGTRADDRVGQRLRKHAYGRANADRAGSFRDRACERAPAARPYARAGAGRLGAPRARPHHSRRPATRARPHPRGLAEVIRAWSDRVPGERWSAPPWSMEPSDPGSDAHVVRNGVDARRPCDARG
ncbi:patatin-like phospholipase family protein [Streptomyces sp. SID10815]|nr:patatin-like phospholipase family protein [Streptomyces sp. SID10815]